jgi:Sec-independent protein secretion pathway component TatC
MSQKVTNPERVMSALDHLIELRRRFIASLFAFVACFIIALAFYGRIIGLITAQFERIEASLGGAKLFANSIAEGFLVQLQASAIVALIVSLPFHLVNMSQFIFPALGARMRKIVSICLVASFALAFIGANIAYFQIIPFSIRFLTDAAFIPRDVGVLLNYQKSISYVLSFLLWTILTFQTPLVLELLLALNVLKRRAVFHASRYIIVLIFIVAAIVTPSVDPISQCAIAAPLILLYFLVLLIAKVFKLGEAGEEMQKERNEEEAN